MTEGDARRCEKSDHAFDALVCALVARAAAIGLTASPTEGDREAARVEGWIAIPGPGTLGRLVRPGADSGTSSPGWG